MHLTSDTLKSIFIKHQLRRSDHQLGDRNKLIYGKLFKITSFNSIRYLRRKQVYYSEIIFYWYDHWLGCIRPPRPQNFVMAIWQKCFFSFKNTLCKILKKLNKFYWGHISDESLAKLHKAMMLTVPVVFAAFGLFSTILT